MIASPAHTLPSERTVARRAAARAVAMEAVELAARMLASKAFDLRHCQEAERYPGEARARRAMVTSLECAARDLRAAAPIIADRVSGTVSRTERRAPLPALTVGDGGAV